MQPRTNIFRMPPLSLILFVISYFHPYPFHFQLDGTSGTTADYMRDVVESVKFAWTPELRGPGFIVDPDQIDPSTQEIWNGLKAKMDHPSFVP